MSLSNSKFVKASHASSHFGVSQRTLRRWANSQKIEFIRKGSQGKYLYNLQRKEEEQIGSNLESSPRSLIYARVSTRKQQDDLERQVQRLREHFPNHEVYTDIASGLNFKRQGFKKILEECVAGRVREVCITDRDRLSRFAYDFIESIFNKFGAKICVLSQDTSPTDHSRLAEDIMSIITVFSARLYGKRSKRNIKAQETGS